MHSTPNLDLDQDGTWYPCYRSKEAQGHWKEYDVTTTYNPPNIQKLEWTYGMVEKIPSNVQGDVKAMDKVHDRNTMNIY